MTRKTAGLSHMLGTTPQSPFDAFKLVVYRHGVVALAAEMGAKPGTLYNKCDADEETHHQPTLRDVMLVTRLTGDTTILESLDRMFNRAGYELNQGPVSDTALMELLCKVGSESGQMHSAVLTALEDGRFSMDELRRVRAEAFDVISAVLNFVQRMEGLVDD